MGTTVIIFSSYIFQLILLFFFIFFFFQGKGFNGLEGLKKSSSPSSSPSSSNSYFVWSPSYGVLLPALGACACACACEIFLNAPKRCTSAIPTGPLTRNAHIRSWVAQRKPFTTR